MTTPTTTPVTGEALTKLAEMLAKATGPDREIDAALASLAGEAPVGWTLIRQDAPRTFKMDAGKWISPEGHRIRTPKPYSSSIDAALALVERMLPDSGWSVTGGHMNAKCTLWPFSDKGDEFVGDAEATPIAILAALVRALAANKNGVDGINASVWSRAC